MSIGDEAVTGFEGETEFHFGLTKREDIAKHLMAQMIRQFGAGENNAIGYEEHARQALFATDALLSALEQ